MCDLLLQEGVMTRGAGREAAQEAQLGQAGRAAMTADPALLAPSAPPEGPVPVGPQAPVMEVLATMRAMRRLKPDPVPRELLEQLVAAATWAPSGSNAQLYGYVVVTDRAQVTRLGVLWREVVGKYLAVAARLDPQAFGDPANAATLAAVRHQAEHFDQTPAVIAACYGQPAVPRDLRVIAGLARDVGPGLLRRLASPRTMIVSGASSSYPGVQNLLLAARALGLAANITVWHFFAENEFKRILGVPGHVTIYALVPVGWPAGRFGPVRRRPAADVIHWDRW
jgi:nitroreductase